MQDQLQLQHLDSLLECLTSPLSSKSFSDLTGILEKYTKILDFTNCCNASYKRATSMYYTDINSIRDNILDAVYAETIQEKDRAFAKAKNGLKKDIQALAILITPAEELAEMAI